MTEYIITLANGHSYNLFADSNKTAINAVQKFDAVVKAKKLCVDFINVSNIIFSLTNFN